MDTLTRSDLLVEYEYNISGFWINLEQIADYLVYIQNGKIIFDDSKEVLKERYYC